MYEMTEDQKRRLTIHLNNAVRDIGIEDVFWCSQILARGSIQTVIITELGRFLQNEMSYRLMQ